MAARGGYPSYGHDIHATPEMTSIWIYNYAETDDDGSISILKRSRIWIDDHLNWL